MRCASRTARSSSGAFLDVTDSAAHCPSPSLEATHMIQPAKTPTDTAQDDIFDAFQNQWRIALTLDARKAFIGLFDRSLGRYLRGIEKVNDRVDIWGDPYLREMPAFVLGFVVAEIAFRLRSSYSDPSVEITVNEGDLIPIAEGVMKEGKTTAYCQFVVTSYQKKLKIPKDHTPICGDIQPFA